MNRNSNNISEIRRLLQKYLIEPRYSENFGKVTKIYSDKGTFALKEATLTEEQLKSFIYTIQNLHQKGYRHAIAIFPTINGELLFKDQGKVYYLMPWIDAKAYEFRNRNEELIKQIAKIHAVTVRKSEVNKSYYKSFYDRAKYSAELRKLEYERFIDQCEKKLYMSPFELLYCTYFSQFMRLEQAAINYLEDWYNIATEKKQDRTVICHGNLSIDHLLFDEMGHPYLTSFERSYVASPLYDLLDYFKKCLYQQPQSVQLIAGSYNQYHRFHHLTKDERLLLFYYLLQTDEVLKLIQQYQKDRFTPEKDFVVKLQRTIWELQAAQTLTVQINETIAQTNTTGVEETEETQEQIET